MCFSCLPQTSVVYRDVIRSSSLSHAYTINKPSWLKINSFQETEKRKHFTFILLQVALGSLDVVGNETENKRSRAGNSNTAR